MELPVAQEVYCIPATGFIIVHVYTHQVVLIHCTVYGIACPFHARFIDYLEAILLWTVQTEN